MGQREEAQLRESLVAAKEMIQELSDKVAMLMSDPLQLGRVTHVTTDQETGLVDRVLVSLGGQLAEMRSIEALKSLTLGSYVTIQGGTIVGVREDLAPAAGSVVVVSDVVDNQNFFATDEGGGNRLYTNHGTITLEKGDRAVIHDGFATKNLGKPAAAYTIADATNVSWDDIGGQDEAKDALVEAIELPYKHADLYKAYGKKTTKGVLMHGPPGSGKTLLAKAAATSLAQTHGAQHSTGFIYVKGPEILNKWVGQSEETVRSLFTRAREHKKSHGYPAVIFIDEADAILGKRGDGGGQSHSTLSATIVPMFLAEMDGFEESAAVVLLATNRPDSLDPAVVRDGRVDRKIYVGRPTQSTAEQIFSIHLKNLALDKEQSIAKLAACGAELLYNPKFTLYNVMLRKQPEPLPFTLGHVASGALIAGWCQQAASTALMRDIKNGQTKKPSGIGADDFVAVASQMFRANRNLNHDDDLEVFVHPFKDQVADVVRAP